MGYDPTAAAAQDDAFGKQWDAQQAAKTAQEAQAKQPPSLLQQFTGAVGRVTTSMIDGAVSTADSYFNSDAGHKVRDVAAGAITGAVNTVDAAGSALATSGREMAAAEDPAHADEARAGTMPGSDIWDHAKSTILDYRDAVAVQDPTLTDNLLQSGAQLALPFAGYSRALSGIHGLANIAMAGAATDATALGPHDPRMADILSLGRHVEGKFGDALRALTPDGSAQNAYINYLADRGNETEAEGRFKNVLDGFGANMLMTPLLHTVGSVLKQGTAGLRYAIDQGMTKASDLIVPPEQPGASVADQPSAEETRFHQPVRPQNASPDIGTIPGPANDTNMAALSPLEQYQAHMRAAGEILKNTPDDARDEIHRLMQAPELPPENRDPYSGKTQAPALPPEATTPTGKNDAYMDSLSQRLQAVNTTGKPEDLHSVLTDMSQNLDESTPSGAFYKELATRLAEKNLGTKITNTTDSLERNPAFSSSKVGPNTAGTYHPGSDEIGLFPSAFANKLRLAHTVTHEAVHAATLDAIKSSPEMATQLTGLIDDVKRLQPKMAGHYGLTNPKEFVAEAESNKSFQDTLMNTKDESGQTLWDQYKAVLGGVLGLSSVAIASPHFDDVLAAQEKNGA